MGSTLVFRLVSNMLLQNLFFFNANWSQIREHIMLHRQVKNYVNTNQSF